MAKSLEIVEGYIVEIPNNCNTLEKFLNNGFIIKPFTHSHFLLDEDNNLEKIHLSKEVLLAVFVTKIDLHYVEGITKDNSVTKFTEALSMVDRTLVGDITSNKTIPIVEYTRYKRGSK